MHHHGRPWGLNGPEFLEIYAAALVVLCGVVAVVRLALRDDELGDDDRVRLAVYERAHLNGGAQQVADAALAGLVESGAVRVSRDRALTATGTEAQDEFQRLVLNAIGEGAEVPHVRKAIARSGRCAPVEQGLRDRKLIVSARARRFMRAVLGLFPLLLVINLARTVNGVELGFPVGGLGAEFVFTLLAWGASAGYCGHPLATAAGEQVKLRDWPRVRKWQYAGHHRRGVEPGPVEVEDDLVLHRDAATEVAKCGFPGYPDRRISELLQPRSNGSGGGAGGAGGSGGGGGGCGGGGC